MVSEVYKIVNDIAPDYIQDSTNIKSQKITISGEKSGKSSSCEEYKNGLRSFRYEAVRIWNCLLNDLRLAESFPQFKRLLHA